MRRFLKHFLIWALVLNFSYLSFIKDLVPLFRELGFFLQAIASAIMYTDDYFINTEMGPRPRGLHGQTLIFLFWTVAALFFAFITSVKYLDIRKLNWRRLSLPILGAAILGMVFVFFRTGIFTPQKFSYESFQTHMAVFNELSTSFQTDTFIQHITQDDISFIRPHLLSETQFERYRSLMKKCGAQNIVRGKDNAVFFLMNAEGSPSTGWRAWGYAWSPAVNGENHQIEATYFPRIQGHGVPTLQHLESNWYLFKLST